MSNWEDYVLAGLTAIGASFTIETNNPQYLLFGLAAGGFVKALKDIRDHRKAHSGV